jgi:hypothetical protein
MPGSLTIQVMPLDATPHPGGAGGFNLIGFPGPPPGVVQVENLLGSSYVEEAGGVRIFADAFERIVAAALSTDDSLAMIARMEEGKRT